MFLAQVRDHFRDRYGILLFAVVLTASLALNVSLCVTGERGSGRSETLPAAGR